MNLFSETIPTSDCPPDGPGAAELRRLAVRLLSTLAERPLSPSEVELEPYLDRLGVSLAALLAMALLLPGVVGQPGAVAEQRVYEQAREQLLAGQFDQVRAVIDA